MRLFGKTNFSVPVDENGNPYYVYHKIKDWINLKQNYRYEIWGRLEYRPDTIEGQPVPVGSTFWDWKTWKLYIMRNWGWAAKDDPDQDPPVIKPVLSALSVDADGTEIEATLNDDILELDLEDIDDGTVVKLKSVSADIPADIYYVDYDSEAVGAKINLDDTLFTFEAPTTRFKFLVVKKDKVVTDIDDGNLWTGIASNLAIPHIIGLRVVTGTAGEMDADIIETGLMQVPTDDVTGADYFNLVSVEADVPVDLYKMDTITGPIKEKIEVGDQIAKILFSYTDNAKGYFLAVPKDYVPTDITDGEPWTFSAERYLRKMYVFGNGFTINEQDPETESPELDVPIHSRYEVTIDWKDGVEPPATEEEFKSLIRISQQFIPSPELPWEVSIVDGVYKVIFSDTKDNTGKAIELTIAIKNTLIVADALHNREEETEFVYKLTIEDAVNLVHRFTDSYLSYYYALSNKTISCKILDSDTGLPVPRVYADTDKITDLTYNPTTGVCTFTMPPISVKEGPTLIVDIAESDGEIAKKLIAERWGK